MTLQEVRDSQEMTWGGIVSKLFILVMNHRTQAMYELGEAYITQFEGWVQEHGTCIVSVLSCITSR